MKPTDLAFACGEIRDSDGEPGAQADVVIRHLKLTDPDAREVLVAAFAAAREAGFKSGRYESMGAA